MVELIAICGRAGFGLGGGWPPARQRWQPRSSLGYWRFPQARRWRLRHGLRRRPRPRKPRSPAATAACAATENGVPGAGLLTRKARADGRARQLHRADFRLRSTGAGLHLKRQSERLQRGLQPGSLRTRRICASGTRPARNPRRLRAPPHNSPARAEHNPPLPARLRMVVESVHNQARRTELNNSLRQMVDSGHERRMYGLAGSDISAVTFTFANGLAVQATVQSGWYFAWWPGFDDPASVQVTTQPRSDDLRPCHALLRRVQARHERLRLRRVAPQAALRACRNNKFVIVPRQARSCV